MKLSNNFAPYHTSKGLVYTDGENIVFQANVFPNFVLFAFKNALAISKV